MISANRDENLGLSIVSIDCSKNGTDDDITIHKVPAMPNGEQPTILKEFQGNCYSIISVPIAGIWRSCSFRYNTFIHFQTFYHYISAYML